MLNGRLTVLPFLQCNPQSQPLQRDLASSCMVCLHGIGECACTHVLSVMCAGILGVKSPQEGRDALGKSDALASRLLVVGLVAKVTSWHFRYSMTF